MKYTNNHNLPEIVRDWLLNDEYDYEPGVMSATGLMKPIRVTVLAERHYDDLVTDVSDLIAVRYGTAIHASFEQVKYPPTIQQEQRVFGLVDGTKISGKFDMLQHVRANTYKLFDIKSTSVWSHVYDSKTEDYVTQLSIYRYLIETDRKVNVEDGADIIMVFTDWSRRKAKDDPTYPQIRMIVKPINLWPLNKTYQYIRDRLAMLADARKLPDDQLPECTAAELWKKPDRYAVVKDGRAKALRILDDRLAADALALKEGGRVEVLKEPVKRCPEYCPAHPFCDQYARLKRDGYIIEGGIE